MDQNLYYDMQRDMSDTHMSLWGSMSQLYKPVQVAATTNQKQVSAAQIKHVLLVQYLCMAGSTYSVVSPLQHSNRSTPSTPPYSQTLALENQMVGPGLLVGGNSRQHLAAPPASVILPVEASTSNTSASNKRGRKNFVDPCAIAPLKKRRIQVDY